MALAPPVRLLLPMRVVDPAHPSSLSSASVCSVAGAYPHFSLFFLHPSTHRSTSPVSARVSEAPSYRNNRQNQFHRHTNEATPFDDLQSPYEEERGRLSYSNRNSNGRTYPAQRSGRGGGSRGRSTREPSNYVPWRSHGVSNGDANSRYGKPWSSQGRYSSSSSQSEEMPGGRQQRTLEDRRNGKPWSSQGRYSSSSQSEDMPGGRRQRTMEYQRNDKFDMRSRNMERAGFAGRGDTYNDNGNTPWERQGSFSQQVSEGAYTENRNPPWEKRGSFAQRGNFSRQDEQSFRQIPPWEDKGRSSWAENRSGTNGRSQRQYNRDVVSEGHSAQWSSHSRNSSSWQSSKWRGDVAEQAPFPGIGLEKKPRIPPIAKNSWSLAPRDYPVAPWQSSVSKEWETKEEEGKEEGSYEYSETNAELKGEQDQNDSARTDVSPIARIMERLRSIDDTEFAQGMKEGGKHSRGGLADYLTLPSAKEYLSDRSSPQPSTEELPKRDLDTRFPWEIEEAATEEDMTVERARRLRPLSGAELTISASELKRLRILSVHLKQRVKIGRHGVSTDLVKSVMQRFRTCEVVKVKCEGPPAGNMKLTLATLEQRTGGLVIWKAGSVAVLYRGKDFGQPLTEIVDDLLAKKLEGLMSTDTEELSSSAGLSVGDGVVKDKDTDKSDNVDVIPEDDDKQASSDVSPVDTAIKQAPPQRRKKLGPEFETMEEYAMEVEAVLTDLGPRYEEWIGPQPVPVDGDLFPSIVPDFRPPYRLLPFGVKPNISNTVVTHLRRLSRPLAPHFVIGRDRGLQGLASAMVKLWEKSEIAKIGIKRGILNTNQERIVEDLKQLTGGFFLCRDKSSMTFYRGKDFLPQAVSAALAERQDMVQTFQYEEETGRLDRSLKVLQSMGSSDVKPSWAQSVDPEEQMRLKKEAVKARRLQIINHIERRLKLALRKKEKAGRELEKVEERMKPVGPSDDKETVTDEERFMLRKLGLKMKAYLLVGRRGVFSGVVQNMHLHWKHRELVKIVVKERDPVHLKEMASMLECESGGILISIDPTSKGYAIVYYRGKNYTRPPELRPPNLLTKRLALKRSVEIQRRSSLTKHIQRLEEEIVHLRAGLSKLNQYTSESSEHQVINEDGADGKGSLKVDGASDNQPTHIQSSVLHNSPLEKQEEAAATFAENGFDFSEEEGEMVISQISKRKLRRLCEMGPIFRAVRLSKTERHAFRNEVLNLSRAAHYLVGKANPLSTIAKAIRLYFLDHAFVKIGVRNRPQGTSVQDIAEELEDLTGGTVYAQDEYRVVLYRGWPTGENMPLDDLYDVLSLEQCDVLEEDGDDDDDDDADDDGDDERQNILKNGLIIDDTVAQYTGDENEEEDDADENEEEDDAIEEDADGPMLADTVVKSMNYVSDEDNDYDLQWDSLSDGNTEDDNEEGDDNEDHDFRWERLSDGDTEDDDEEGQDDHDDLRWVGLSDGDVEGEEKKGDVVLRVDKFSNKHKHSENFLSMEKIDGVYTEASLRWDSLVFDDNDAGTAGGMPSNLDLDEDV